MTKFAPVAPIHILEKLHEAFTLGTYHLVLTHDVEKQRERFTALFKHRDYRHATVFIDNSVIELGEPTDFRRTLACREYFPCCENVVCVLPDVLLDSYATVVAAGEGLESVGVIDGSQLMFVPQGRTLKELAQCAEDFSLTTTKIGWIGVARNITELLGSRKEAIEVLEAIYPRARMHLLGFSSNLVDDIICCRHPKVEGIDSAVPLRQSTKIKMSQDDPGSRGNWWETAQYSRLVYDNVQQVREWIR